MATVYPLDETVTHNDFLGECELNLDDCLPLDMETGQMIALLQENTGSASSPTSCFSDPLSESSPGPTLALDTPIVDLQLPHVPQAAAVAFPMNEKKRRRRSDHESSPSEDCQDVEQAEKKQKRLMKNRLAAQQCRRKKKEYLHEMEIKVKQMEAQISSLSGELTEVKAENKVLKGEVGFLQGLMQSGASGVQSMRKAIIGATGDARTPGVLFGLVLSVGLVLNACEMESSGTLFNGGDASYNGTFDSFGSPSSGRVLLWNEEPRVGAASFMSMASTFKILLVAVAVAVGGAFVERVYHQGHKKSSLLS